MDKKKLGLEMNQIGLWWIGIFSKFGCKIWDHCKVNNESASWEPKTKQCRSKNSKKAPEIRISRVESVQRASSWGCCGLRKARASFEAASVRENGAFREEKQPVAVAESGAQDMEPKYLDLASEFLIHHFLKLEKADICQNDWFEKVD